MPKPPAQRAASRARQTRILLASNSHPALTKGGAEIAAFELFRHLLDATDFDPYFLACAREPNLDRFGPALTQPFGEREFIYSLGDFDWVRFANRDRRFPSEFRALLADLRPGIVHFHHYMGFGIEAFQFVREILPHALIVVTLHEYLLICNHFGQMITKPARNLCQESSPLACAKCFPEIGAADFFLRRLYLDNFLRHVDLFLSPSHFLARRYIEWGIPAERMSVIENVVACVTPSTAPAEMHAADSPKPKLVRRANDELARSLPPIADRQIRLGFFGQISALKGIKVFLDAARILEEEGNRSIVFDIFGDHRNQPPDFQAEFLEVLKQAGRNTHFHGPYDQRQVDALMQSVDLVCVPSIWWENSPVVIQEALRNRRPIICSNIGGMAEKVRNGLDGVHFVAGNAHSLAQTVGRLAENPERIVALQESIRPLQSPADTINGHIRLYRNAMAALARAPVLAAG
jgi:glycosyltransferase involved in cell wall biosynthesis